MKAKITIASLLLLVSCALSSWLYWGDDLKLEKMLTAKEWQSKFMTVINDPYATTKPVQRRITVTTNVKYLKNGTYMRMSMLRFSDAQSEQDTIMNISESGDWEISDNYLLVNPKQFKDLPVAHNPHHLSNESLKLITTLFKNDARQSRRIDIVNSKTLLLTSLNQGSTVLFLH